VEASGARARIAAMTWSIVARDASGALGVAVASRFFAVGALCPAVLAGHGALSTQALINPLYAKRGLAALAAGRDAAATLRTLLEADAGRDVRQVHVVDAAGRSAAHTGIGCIEWCGHHAGAGFSVAGNMLAGPQVVDETVRAWTVGAALPFAERLIEALAAGEAAGGDKRGKQAAALLVHTTEDYPFLSLRVDDHPEPIQELRRLYAVSRERFQPFTGCLATRVDPVGLVDRTVIEARIAAFQAETPKR
jgi:uncharacterized Ntn-hydrolase superfamily protein